jgi:hypothetical protein
MNRIDSLLQINVFSSSAAIYTDVVTLGREKEPPYVPRPSHPSFQKRDDLLNDVLSTHLVVFNLLCSVTPRCNFLSTL